MAGNVQWKFSDATGGFTGLYQPGQSMKESFKQLNDYFATKLGNVDLMMEGLRTVFPGYTITPQERAEAPQRREISALARNTMFTLLHKREAEHAKKPENLTMERGFDMLYDVSGSASAKDWNDQVRSLFVRDGSVYPNGTKEQRGQMIAQFIDRLENTNFDRLYHMSDRELAGEFDQLYPLLTFLSEAGDSILGLEGTVYTLPDGYADKVKEMKADHQTMMISLRARFEYIARPEYEIIPYERICLPRGRDFDFYVENLEASPDEKTLDERVRDDAQIDVFFECAFGQQEMFGASILERANHEIRKLNLPEELLNPPVYDEKGKKLPSPLLDFSLPDGKALSKEDLYPEQIICFTNPLTKHENFLWPDGNGYTMVDFSHAPDAILKTEATKALKELEAADPWRIRAFTGSNEYKEMKAAMKDLAEFTHRMPKSPTFEQRQEYWDKVRDLEEKQTAYEKTKGDLSESTKESERARITASNIAKKCVQDAYLLMGGYEKAVSVREKMHKGMQDAIDSEMGKQADKENRYEKARTTTTGVPRYREAQVQTNLEKTNDSQKVWAAYGKELPINDSLKALGLEIHMDGYHNDKPDVLNTMAKMVAYDLIARERVGKSSAGPIEKAFLADQANFIKGLESSQTLKNIAASVEKNGELKAFMLNTVGAGVKKLSDNVLVESKGQQVQNNQSKAFAPGAEMRNAIEAQAPVVPKPQPSQQGPMV